MVYILIDKPANEIVNHYDCHETLSTIEFLHGNIFFLLSIMLKFINFIKLHTFMSTFVKQVLESAMMVDSNAYSRANDPVCMANCLGK